MPKVNALPPETARLIYLADALRIHLPAQFTKHLFMGDLIAMVSQMGWKAALMDLGLPAKQFEAAMAQGQSEGPPDESEFRILVASQAMDELESQRDDLGLTKYLQAISNVNEFARASKSDMIAFHRKKLSDLDSDEAFPKWKSQFTPLDLISDGLYQGIFLLLAKSGDGKTSTMLTLMEQLALSGVESLWYISTEIPMNMMKYRMSPILNRTAFPENFEVMTGRLTPRQIILMAEEEPDENRIIIHDSPDALGGDSNERRFSLEDHYRDLVELKEMSRAVFTVSQIRRNDKIITLESVAEAWAKAWYSDAVWGIAKNGYDHRGFGKLKASMVKNRFGPVDNFVSYAYDYNRLEFDASNSEVFQMGDDWSEELPGKARIPAPRGEEGY